jgi:hypothetical protein
LIDDSVLVEVLEECMAIVKKRALFSQKYDDEPHDDDYDADVHSLLRAP